MQIKLQKFVFSTKFTHWEKQKLFSVRPKKTKYEFGKQGNVSRRGVLKTHGPFQFARMAKNHKSEDFFYIIDCSKNPWILTSQNSADLFSEGKFKVKKRNSLFSEDIF